MQRRTESGIWISGIPRGIRTEDCGDAWHVYDHRTEGRIHITKKDRDLFRGESDDYSSYGDAEGDGTLEGAVYGLFAAEDIVHPDAEVTGNGILTNTGVVYKKNDLVAAAATDRDGNADFLCYTEAPGVEYDYTAGKIRKRTDISWNGPGNLYQENMEKNIKLLKSDIIPFLGNYISETRNLGKIRDLINLLTFNTSRYENGNLDGVVDAFKRLSDFPAFRRHFASMDRAEIRELFQNIDFDRAAGKEEWSEQFLSLLRMGAEGKAGIENKEDFMTLLHGMLINESVYMPVLHVTLPFILDGTPVFSEIWLDPDDSSGGGETPGESGVKLLLKFDMKEVGFFDIFCYYEEGKMDLLLHYPENLLPKEKEIREGIADILKKNGMEIRYLAVEQGKESIPVSAAFPQIYERRNMVNVTI